MTWRACLIALLLSLAAPGRADMDAAHTQNSEFLDKIMNRKTPGPRADAPRLGAATGGADAGFGTSGGLNSAAEPPAQTAQAAAQGVARRQGASQSAARIAEQLKAGAMGDPGAAQAVGAAANPAARGVSDGRDLLVASVSGQGAVFKDMGLRTVVGADGRVAVVDASGKPVSAAEVARLKERLASEPEALIRRPDFYQVMPRARFHELKDDYRSRPDLHDTSFKHMGLTAAERDFQWAQSCQQLSGDCNEAEVSNHYAKGELVAPETLEKTWEKIHPAPAADEDESIEAQMDALRAKKLAAYEARKRANSLAGALGRLRSRLGRVFSGGGPDVAEESGERGTPALGGRTGAGQGPGPRSRRDDESAGAATGARFLAPPAPERPPRAGRSVAVGMAAVGAGLAAVGIWMRRRRNERKGEPS